MDWISRIRRDDSGRLCVEAQGIGSGNGLATLADMSADLRVPGSVRRKVRFVMDELKAGAVQEYLAKLGLAHLEPGCQQVYEGKTEIGTVVIPSQLLVLATVGSSRTFREALLRPWGPTFLMTPGVQAEVLTVVPTPHRAHRLLGKPEVLETRMGWVLTYPSVTAAWCSVYANALKGQFDMRLPFADVTASVRGKFVDGKFFVTRLQLLELLATEPPFDFALGHGARKFVFNESVHRRPTHGQAAAPASDAELLGTADTKLSDAAWAQVEPVLKACLVTPGAMRPGRQRQRQHSLRDILDVILLKLGTPYSWSKCPGDKALVQSASVLLSQLQRAQAWPRIVACIRGVA